ncbi:SDR family oxidoreductase [Mailhella sp.]|uniref:SDR family oxidoreductase n=1 Tax=Mailhella sp. TaxID=1981029 RepID=UPI0040631C4E
MAKIILITGATSGFGLASARLFASRGWKVIGTGRRAERLSALHDELGDAFLPLPLDMRDREAVSDKLGSLPEGWQDVDVLLNNAGGALGLDPAYECSLDDWDTMVDTNIKGLLYATRAVLPGMVERNSGHVVMLGSIAGNYPYGGGNVYCGTKAFVKQFSLSLRADLLGKNVRVSNIEPGLAESEFSVVRFHGDEARAASVYEGTQPITPDDIAETVWWIVNCPAHININRVEIMPVCQCPNGATVKKGM